MQENTRLKHENFKNQELLKSLLDMLKVQDQGDNLGDSGGKVN